MEELRMPGGRRFGQGEKSPGWAEDYIGTGAEYLRIAEIHC
jgi:hypothetical protein